MLVLIFLLSFVIQKEALKKSINEFESLCLNTNPKLYVTQIDNQLELYKVLTMIYFSDTSLDHLMTYNLVELFPL